MYSEQATEPLTPTRKRIYAAAMTLFAELGVTRVSISELAAAAGMARGTIYSNVNDLDGLFEEVAAHLVREMTERVVRGFAGIDDPAQRLALGIRQYIRRAHAEPDWGRFMSRFGLSSASLQAVSSSDRSPTCAQGSSQAATGSPANSCLQSLPRSAVPHWRRCSPCWKDMAPGATSVPTPRSWCWSPSASLARRRGRSRGASWRPCRAPTEGPGTDRASGRANPAPASAPPPPSRGPGTELSRGRPRETPGLGRAIPAFEKIEPPVGDRDCGIVAAHGRTGAAEELAGPFTH